ncbi:hypothetical protein BS78_K066700 [Paspalum vaginatum]|uniref:Mediator complex subunit 15 KIX domain-containing protein n=1 Tax=Paspalum vaginatum TaxID=158149 RepID=A0A9W7X8D5_9POAL|nr:hypothetical protein BS78_K066700 [Paspalum vaginatum]
MQGGGAGLRWKDELDPKLRLSVVQRIAPMLAEFRETPEQLHQLAANFEQDIFNDAQSKIDYLRRVSNRVIIYHKLINLRADADRQQQQMQMQMVHQMQVADTVQAIHGVNYPFAAAPQGVPTMASPSWPPYLSPNQHMACPSSESNLWTDVHQGPPPDMMHMFYQIMNSHPATVAPVVPNAHSSEQIMHSVYMQCHNQRLAMQLQPPTNVVRGHLASRAAQLQGQPIARSNGHQDHLLDHNICANTQHLHPTAHRQRFGITQQQLGANVVNTNNSHSSGFCDNQLNPGWDYGLQSPLKACEQVAIERQTNMECQPMPPPQKQITANQQSNVHCPSPQNPARMASAGEVDWRE